MQYRRKAILGACIALVLIGAGVWVFWLAFRVTVLRDVPASAVPIQLPAGAAHVTYQDLGAFAPYRNVTFTAHEAEFVAWAMHLADRKLEQKEGDVTIPFAAVGSTQPFVEAKDGVELFWEEGDRSEYFLFDRTNGVGYFQLDNR